MIFFLWGRHLFFRRKKSFTLILQENRFTRNIAQYPVHYVTYKIAKFEVAMPDGLGEDTITRNRTGGWTDIQTDVRLDDGLS